MIREVLTPRDLAKLSPREAAALLLIRQDAGGGGGDDDLLDEWLAAGQENAEAWVETCSVWQSLGDIGPTATGLAGLREPTPASPEQPTRWGFGMAASVAALVGLGAATFFAARSDRAADHDGTQVAQTMAVTRMLKTSKGEHRSFGLADGSTVTLNTASAAAVAFRPGGERRVDLLRGQAFFEVAHDASRPFVVDVQGRTVTALGTAFEVRVDDDRMRVILVEGRVSVRSPAVAPVVLLPGQQLVASAGSLSISAADVTGVTDWRRGVVTFNNTSLATAATELNRYSSNRLVVDPSASQITVNGVFHTDDTMRFARTIAQAYPVRVVTVGTDTIRVSALNRGQAR